ncbi:unnamed protein product [Ophioblennius macclurei]
MAERPLTDWSSGLCDCFEDASTCCYGFWCCPCLACTVSGRFGENNCLPLCDVCSPAILAFCGIPLFVPPATLSMRAAMRNRYGIKGSICKDIFTSCFCSWCIWCQMHRELKERKKTPTVINAQPQNYFVAQPAPVVMMPAAPVYTVNQPGLILPAS